MGSGCTEPKCTGRSGIYSSANGLAEEMDQIVTAYICSIFLVSLHRLSVAERAGKHHRHRAKLPNLVDELAGYYEWLDGVLLPFQHGWTHRLRNIPV